MIKNIMLATLLTTSNLQVTISIDFADILYGCASVLTALAMLVRAVKGNTPSK